LKCGGRFSTLEAMLPRSCLPVFPFVLLLVSACAPARAQGNHALCTVDGLDAWAVGDSGRWYRSFDGGTTWTTGTLGTATLRAVAARGFRVVMAGDGGVVWASEDGGGHWLSTVLPGAPTVRSLAFGSDTVAFAAGDGGLLARSTDGGVSWHALPSITTARLDALTFDDAQHGWVAGEGGLVAVTGDGGATWTATAPGVSSELLAVHARGSSVLVGGVGGVCRLSTDAGAHWSVLDLKLDALADVRGVWIASPDTLWVVGGGGFIRKSHDGGARWTFPVHGLQGVPCGIAFAGGHGFVASERHRAVLASADGGTSWALPAGTSITRAWHPRFAIGAAVRGNTLTFQPRDPHTLMCLMGTQLFVSRDEGESWQPQGNPIPEAVQSNSLVVSPRDSNVLLAASVFFTPPARRVVRSTDGGVSWTPVLAHDFGEFGDPLERDPDRPDTVWFGASGDTLMRSTDFGLTWSRWGGQAFNDPCDIVVVPDTDAVMLVGDGIEGIGPGRILRSADGGQSFSVRWSNPGNGSEVPVIATSRLRNATSFATNWGTGGVMRSTDYGVTWPVVAPTVTAWGVDVARDDPNVVVYGTFSIGQSFLSVDGGDAFTSIPLPGQNYSFLARDRGLVLAMQSLGLYKLDVGYDFSPAATQALALTAPAGGEQWVAGSRHAITWAAMNVAIVHVEYRRSPSDPWQAIADVAADAGHYDWTVPDATSSEAVLRVSDRWDGVPVATSAAFGIVPPVLALAPIQPNPVTEATVIRYTLPVRTRVQLAIYTLQGRRVATLASGETPAGAHAVTWDPGHSLVAGVYWCRLEAAGRALTRKLTVLR
jgi:photosystem II stability/assembly factor-like uncharacterized protein